MPLSVFEALQPWSTWLFFIATLEFVLRFTNKRQLGPVRGMQIGLLLLPIASLLHFEVAYNYFSVTAQFLFCGLIVFILFRAWRRGQPEAGVMLIPFFLAATADSSDALLDFAASRKWIPDSFASHSFHLGPVQYSTSTVTYLVFLGSLISVILYRFIRVSQVEQRSAAEIEAARSVQALLIPTTFRQIKTSSSRAPTCQPMALVETSSRHCH